MEKQKIAFLIICHKNIEQIAKLIRLLVSDDSYVFLHFDSQFTPKVSTQNLKSLIKPFDNVYLTDQRIHGNLNRRSLVDITFLMIKKAMKIEKQSNIKFMYFYLLSGQDYPLVSISEITDKLFNSYPRNFIDCQSEKSEEFLHYIWQGYYKSRLMGFAIEKAKPIFPIYILLRIINKLSKKTATKEVDYAKLKRMNISLYSGSAWWCLNDLVISKIYKEYKSKKKYLKILINSRTPEESFFQTLMMMNADDRFCIKEFVQDVGKNTSLTYPFFFDETHPPANHPYIMDLKKTKEIKEMNKYCFARKYDITNEESKKAMAYLDRLSWRKNDE